MMILQSLKKRSIVLITMILGLAIFYACQDDEIKTKQEITTPGVKKAICILHPTEGSTAKGRVTFTETNKGMRVVAEMTGLSEGRHGFHIHTYGDCSALDAKSAGGHFNPYDKPHGGPGDDERHVGDLGNITASADGTATLDMIDTHLGFEGDNSIIGRAIVVHAGEDDLVSQPTGDAGARVACGVIGIAKK